ncbi:hypothetical protein ABPG75_012617 [Micractinium tetrahymenae]
MAALLACAGQAAVLTDDGEPAYQTVPGRLIIKMDPNFVSAMDTNSHGLRFARPAGSQGAALYTITDGKSVAQKLAEMADNPAFEYAEPDYRVPVNWQPNDSLFSVQWHHAAVASPLAWNATTGRPEVKVCHIDSGVRTDHPDLQARVLKGWNLVPEVQDFDQEEPAPGSPQYRNINDSYGHGTHTAGIIAAVGNNALGVAGIAMDVRLLVCRFIWDDGFGSISDALECLRLCKEEGAVISSNSWGGVPRSRAIEEGLKEIEEAGMLFVVASGNQGIDLDARPAFPASSGLPNILVVGSSGATNQASKFSNTGRSTVHLLAPGEQILSTTFNGWYGPMDGTSMACPLVAGAAALLHSAALNQGVQLSYAELKSLLLSSTDASPAESAGKTVTGGRLNVGSAMAALALLLQERGDGQIPGGFLADSSAAEELQQRMLQNSWGQGLLQGAAPGGSSPQPSVVARGGTTASGLPRGGEAQAQGRQAPAQAMSADGPAEAAPDAQAQPGRAAPLDSAARRRRQLRAGSSLLK